MNRNVTFADDAALLQVQNKSPQRASFLRFWWSCHLRALLFACGEIIHRPFTNVMTLFVIGIAFALPATLFALLQNVEGIASYWHSAPKITLYLQQNISNLQRAQLMHTLQQNKAIATAHYISPAAGLQSLQDSTTTANAIKALGSNPLPGVIEVTPTHANQNPRAIQTLYKTLQPNKLINSTQLNIAWVKRLFYFLETLKNLTIAISTLFAVGLVLIVGNTIRLAMKNHEDEIYVLSLIGATRAFIRRPLLYRGLLFGAIGGVIAWILCSCILWWMETPAAQLALTYNNTITLHGLSFTQGITIVFCGGLLGYLGARLTINHYLRKSAL